MKSRILILLLLLTVSGMAELYAQANCTTPPDCIQNTGTDLASFVMAPWGTPVNSPGFMVPHWEVFSGTPIFGPGYSTTNGIHLISDVSNGEGVYTCYNFRAGHNIIIVENCL